MGSDQSSIFGDVVATTIAVIALSPAAFAQQQVMEPWQIPCTEEVVQSNLEVETEQHVFGQLKDRAGSPFAKSKVLLRKEREKGKFVDDRSVLTDRDGSFDLQAVDPGRYRFLPGPNRGWKQPRKISCSNGSNCELNLTLELNPTDQPFAGCPVQ